MQASIGPNFVAVKNNKYNIKGSTYDLNGMASANGYKKTWRL